MLYSLIGLALALQVVEPPRGVNDEVLGTAEAFRVAGPARVCLISTSIDLLPGENAYLEYLGIHNGSIRVVGPQGSFTVMEGEAFLEPRGGRLEQDRRGRTVTRHRRDGRPRYLLYSRSGSSRGRGSPRTWVEGDALGGSHVRMVLDRVNIAFDGPSGCQRRFIYGWNTVLGPAQE
ncbi:MAG TPA: hypothetical protein VEW71_01440 [Allosphingosinicella sp.]|nr:hypothetical protein [Allosphingosinicella sp.]